MTVNQLSQPTFIVYTLFDITQTGVTKSATKSEKARNQQRNWETLQQVLGLRTQPLNLKSPTRINSANLEQYEFGNQYQGCANVWTTEFTVDQPDTFLKNNDPVALLCEDANLIPMITGLDESVAIIPGCTQVKNNIYFQLLYREVAAG